MPSALPQLCCARYRDVPTLGDVALVVVDFQRVFTDPASPAFLLDAPAALRRAQRLLRYFRDAARPIAFTWHAHRAPPGGPGLGSWWSHFILVSDSLAGIDPHLAPRPGEPVFRKERYSAFHRTRLRAWLESKGVTTVVLAGVMTHVCVDTTARDGISLGFDVIIAADACASKSAALHEASLQCLSHAVARVVTVRRLGSAIAEVRR